MALAGDQRATVEHAAPIDEVYLALGALSTLLDSIVDYEQRRRPTARSPTSTTTRTAGTSRRLSWASHRRGRPARPLKRSWAT